MMTDLHPIFAECCGAPWSLYGTEEPFQQDGYLCATNGAIIVRIKHEGEDTPNAPAVAIPWWPDEDNAYDTNPTVLPEVSYAGLTTCAECRGTKKVKCYECGGDPIRGGHSFGVPCGGCNGKGQWDCEECDDEGKTLARSVAVEVADDYGLADRYIDLLRRHHAKVFLPTSRDPKAPAYFTIEGEIDGLLMPMRLS